MSDVLVCVICIFIRDSLTVFTAHCGVFMLAHWLLFVTLTQGVCKGENGTQEEDKLILYFLTDTQLTSRLLLGPLRFICENLDHAELTVFRAHCGVFCWHIGSYLLL